MEGESIHADGDDDDHEDEFEGLVRLDPADQEEGDVDDGLLSSIWTSNSTVLDTATTAFQIRNCTPQST
jgi:hypothetical protein